MSIPIHCTSCKASIPMIATMQDGTKRMCRAEVLIQETRTYSTIGGGDRILLEGKIERGGNWIDLGNPDEN